MTGPQKPKARKPPALPGKLQVKPFDPFDLSFKPSFDYSVEPEAKPQSRPRNPATSFNLGSFQSPGYYPVTPAPFGALAPLPNLRGATESADPLNDISPLPVSSYDWQGRAEQWAGKLFGATDEDDALSISKKIEKRRQFTDALSKIPGDVTPQDIDEIAMTYYQAFAPKERPFAQFSDEAQAALNEAYAPMTAGQATLSSQDIDPNQAIALGAMMIGNLFRGQSFRDMAPYASALLQSAQSRLDTRNQAELNQDAMRRRAALDRYKRLTQLEDYNNEQAGYEARDARMAARNLASQIIVGDRQSEAANAREKAAWMNDIRSFIMKGDPARAAALAEVYENQYDERLPESFRALMPTLAQKKTVAETAGIEATTRKTDALTQKIRFGNRLDQETFDDQVKRIRALGQKGELEVKKLELQLDYLDDQLKADVAKTWTQIETMKQNAAARAKQAEASMVRARKAGSGGGKNDPLNVLKALVNGFNSSIDNKRQKYGDLATSLSVLKAEKTRLNLLGGKLPTDPNPDVDGRIQQIEREMSTTRGEIDGETAKVNRALDHIEKAAGLQQAPPAGGK